MIPRVLWPMRADPPAPIEASPFSQRQEPGSHTLGQARQAEGTRGGLAPVEVVQWPRGHLTAGWSGYCPSFLWPSAPRL